MKWIRAIVHTVVVVASIFAIVAALYVVNILSSVDLGPFERIKGSRFVDDYKNKFEADSIVATEELQLFLSFGHFPGGERLSLSKLEREGKVSIEGKKTLILEDFELFPLISNDCEENYCIKNDIGFNQIPANMWKGLIGVEDYRFLDHVGIDLKSIIRAIIIDLKEMKMVQGGSTLTQQLVKNLYLTNEKKIGRKVKEVIISLYLEKTYDKEIILETYFNEVFWGSIGNIQIKGVNAASLVYFDKAPIELDPYEAAILVGMLKGPNYYSPIKYLERLKKRTNLVYRKLKEKSLVPLKHNFSWDQARWKNWQEKIISKNKSSALRSLWWTMSEKSLIEEYQRFVIKKKMLDIHKGIDYEDMAFKVFLKNIKSGEVYSVYSKFERSKKKAMDKESHQIGSTIKPIIYGIFQDNGMSWEDVVGAGSLTLDLLSGKWSPGEAGSKSYEKVTAKEALLKSLNRPLIRIAKEIGFEKIEMSLKESFGDYLKTPLSEYPAQLLGAIELPVADYAEIYEEFISKNCMEYGDQSVLATLSDPKVTTVRKVVSKNLKNMRFFGKTGTTNRGLDNWFVGFDGEELILIWFGHEGARTKDKDFKLYGSTTAFRLYQEYSRDKGKRFNELNCEIFSK